MREKSNQFSGFVNAELNTELGNEWFRGVVELYTGNSDICSRVAAFLEKDPKARTQLDFRESDCKSLFDGASISGFNLLVQKVVVDYEDLVNEVIGTTSEETV